MKNCPFCAHAVDMENPDTLYPNGVGWILRDNGMITYHSFRDAPKENWCYSMHCPTTAGGCGVEMSANTKEEAIEKWNKRVIQCTHC
jgi:hypothetical protein